MNEQYFRLQDILKGTQTEDTGHAARKRRYEVMLHDTEGKGRTNARTTFTNGKTVDIPAHHRWVKAANEQDAWRIAAHIVFQKFLEISHLRFHEVGNRRPSKYEGRPVVHQAESSDVLKKYTLQDDGRIERPEGTQTATEGI